MDPLIGELETQTANTPVAPGAEDALFTALGPGAEIHRDESMARHSALRIGGTADLFLVARQQAVLCEALVACWSSGLPCRVLGGGANVLVSDAGVRGLVILNRTRSISFTSDVVWADSGVSFSTLARKCISRGLAGLEWAIGIPGTVGGAVVGNAGAWGSDVASTLISAEVMEPPGEIATWCPGDFQYGYRASILKGAKPSESAAPAVLQAQFQLARTTPSELEARAKEIEKRRRASQPPGATCGSVFKNPAGDYAGRLIEAAGLKGRRAGNAEISTVHANFITNRGHASAGNVMALIDVARRTVKDKEGIQLELEIELLGDW